MKRSLSPIDIIEPLRESDDYIQTIYMSGGCFQFHVFLRSLFPGAKPYMHKNKDHVVSLIGNKMYDIRGEIHEAAEVMYSPFTAEDFETVSNWSFAGHNLLLLGECKYCEEPITIEPYR